MAGTASTSAQHLVSQQGNAPGTRTYLVDVATMPAAPKMRMQMRQAGRIHA